MAAVDNQAGVREPRAEPIRDQELPGWARPTTFGFGVRIFRAAPLWAGGYAGRAGTAAFRRKSTCAATLA